MEDVWAKKVELPDFMGTDPIGWIVRAERFFEENETHPNDMLQWAFTRMEGEAMYWFNFRCQEDLNADWKLFSRAMIRRFGAQMKHGGVVAGKSRSKNRVVESNRNKR